VYIFLFAHTEDQFNHDLSEERYTRIVPMVEDIANSYPLSGIVWTTFFQGSDAKTVFDRNATTGVVDLLKNAAAQGILAFGYHGQHDPTYTNRPTNALTTESTFGETVDAVSEWVSCVKDPTVGGCVADTGGGLLAVENGFGHVRIVSGITAGPTGGMSYEGSAGSHAVRRHISDRMLAFGISDHAPGGGSTEHDAAVAQLMALATPSIETSGTVFWLDNAVRINDGDRLNDITAFQIEDAVAENMDKVVLVDRTRKHIFNAGLGSKWIYVKTGATSPTNYGYANPTSPEEPAINLNSRAVIDENYNNIKTTLEWFAGTWFPDNPTSRFVGPDEILSMTAPSDYGEVTREELDAVARWLLEKWTTQPPPYASDGTEFYSLRDALGLFAISLSSDMPASVSIPTFHGPMADAGTLGMVELRASGLDSFAADIATAIAAGAAAWSRSPPDMVKPTYTTFQVSVNTAQLLYAFAMLYASRYANQPLDSVSIPASASMPQTLETLTVFGCLVCTDSAWSFKPARIRAL
jgi:hypothetical protein